MTIEWRADDRQFHLANGQLSLVLRVYEDLPEDRVADILGCRPGTVRSLVFRGLAELRVHVRSDDDG